MLIDPSRLAAAVDNDALILFALIVIQRSERGNRSLQPIKFALYLSVGSRNKGPMRTYLARGPVNGRITHENRSRAQQLGMRIIKAAAQCSVDKE